MRIKANVSSELGLQGSVFHVNDPLILPFWGVAVRDGEVRDGEWDHCDFSSFVLSSLCVSSSSTPLADNKT